MAAGEHASPETSPDPPSLNLSPVRTPAHNAFGLHQKAGPGVSGTRPPSHVPAQHSQTRHLDTTLGHPSRQWCRMDISEPQPNDKDNGVLPYDPTGDDDDPIVPLLERDPSLEHQEACKELARLLRLRGDVLLWDGPPRADEPTDSLPGSPEKLEVMMERAGRREKVFHPDDVIVSDTKALEIAPEPRKKKGSRRRANGAQPLEDRRQISQGGQPKPDRQREEKETMTREVWQWQQNQKS